MSPSEATAPSDESGENGVPEPKCLVSYAGMIPIRFSGSRTFAISASDVNILGTPTSCGDFKPHCARLTSTSRSDA